jgi:putative ABC transport system substrate-binding protein
MKRREFIMLVGGAAAWPLAARAQQPGIPVIGYLNSVSLRTYPPAYLEAFHAGLGEAGFVAGKNVTIEYRWADDQYDRLPVLATELVRRQVAVIAALGSANTAQAARAATATIPIVFATGSDPVKVGLVTSLNRPGANMTGVTLFTTELDAKRLELLQELLPHVATIAFITNPLNINNTSATLDLQAAARSIGREIVVLNASTENEIDAAFANAAQRSVGALLVNGDSFLFSRRDRIAALAARHGIPASYNTREYVTAGGLMSYGDIRTDSSRLAGIYTGRILKGETPASLPVQQPSRFEFVMNLKAAKTLGITFPLSFHVRANEVIE